MLELLNKYMDEYNFSSLHLWPEYEQDIVLDEYKTYAQGIASEKGEYNTVYVIFEVEDVLYRKTGSYNSYDGILWDGPLEEVQCKTVVQYIPIERDEC